MYARMHTAMYRETPSQGQCTHGRAVCAAERRRGGAHAPPTTVPSPEWGLCPHTRSQALYTSSLCVFADVDFAANW